MGLLRGEGRLKVVTLPNCDSFRTTLLTEERFGASAAPDDGWSPAGLSIRT